ncbi:MAG: hypothetical protein AAGA86_02250 [Bacteroidota bacterium]
MKKEPDFKMPRGYLEGFNSDLLKRLEENQGITIPKNDGLGIPEGYLEGFNERLKEKLETQEIKVVSLPAWRNYFYAAASIAAAILVFLGINGYPGNQFTYGDLAQADIESYFDDNDFGLSSYELAETLALEDMEGNDILEEALEEQNIMEYLDDNLDDFEELNMTIDEDEQ